MRTTTIITFVLINFACYSQTFVPEHKAVKIILSTDKTTYYPFEPILLNIELQNTSNQKQSFREISVTGTVLKYLIESKKRKFTPFPAFHELIGTGGMTTISEETMILPMQSKKGSVIINKYFDLSNYYGDLKVTFGYPIYTFKEGVGELLTGYKDKSIKISIKHESTPERIPVKLFSEVISKVLGADPFNKKVSENLEKIIAEYPKSYIVDQAYYFLSVYYYQVYEFYKKPEQLEASKKYITEFLQRFPQSVYRKEGQGLEKMINAR